jgi:hypothetical protein
MRLGRRRRTGDGAWCRRIRVSWITRVPREHRAEEVDLFQVALLVDDLSFKLCDALTGGFLVRLRSIQDPLLVHVEFNRS